MDPAHLSLLILAATLSAVPGLVFLALLVNLVINNVVTHMARAKAGLFSSPGKRR